MAPIAVGDVIPDGTLTYLDEAANCVCTLTRRQEEGHNIWYSSLKHVRCFVEKEEELKAKGVDEFMLVSVNDPHVMNAWAKSYPENKHVKFLADGSAKYTHALGLELDLTERGLGIRSRRFALLIDDLKVKVANVESGGEFTFSSADDILKALQTVDAFLSTGAAPTSQKCEMAAQPS